MRLFSKAGIRLAGFAAASLLLTLTLACINRPVKRANPDPDIWYAQSVPQSVDRDVDILFVIDNSGSMEDEQENLRLNFSALMQSLRNMTAGLPNVHVGVVSTDIGTGMFTGTGCDVGGQAGDLLTSGCQNPSGVPYIVDVEPLGCNIDKDEEGQCGTTDCGPENCDHEGSTSYVVDSLTGCPRCRNYTNESLEDVFSCMADLGTLGCGFEQPLEAMHMALTPDNSHNAGFVRDDAYLAVVFITDEDDCSANTPALFDDTQTGINTTLGPLWSYRCFEFGITCDVNERAPGQRHDCVVRDDAAAMLYPTARYEQLLTTLKDPQQLMLAAIAGPVNPSASGVGFDAQIGLTGSGYPDLQPSCGGNGSAEDGAVPGIRLYSLLEKYNDEAALAEWAYTSICSADFSPALKGIGDALAVALDQCLPTPLKGCSDPGVEFGAPQAAQTCAVNAQCLAQCSVEDVFGRNTAEEVRYEVPPCLEILPDGTREEGNTDRSRAYANGHPLKRDPDLPVAACWHINYQPSCEHSNGAEILVSRRENPPPRSFAEIKCVQLAPVEQLCNDMRDNDENCLTDAEDPCCIDPESCR